MDRYPYHYEMDACRDGVHGRCSGRERDAGDGTVGVCECACHDEGPDAAYDTWAEAEGRA